jgi:oxygen-independent coproporphyrinogen-3 oxidase
VSNWARDDAARCRHNDSLWRGGEWWGIGPGAHSGVGGRRWWNVRHPATWAARVGAGELPVEGDEQLSAQQRRLERLMLAVRTREGVPAGAADEAGRLAGDGLVDLAGDRAVLTLRGRLLADHVTRRLAG